MGRFLSYVMLQVYLAEICVCLCYVSFLLLCVSFLVLSPLSPPLSLSLSFLVLSLFLLFSLLASELTSDYRECLVTYYPQNLL